MIGGGTGLATLLRGLKKYTSKITAVVTMCDDGASTGRIREELGCLPPGDIRQCLAALADEEPLLTKLFQYRYEKGDGLAGHSFGNLFIAALQDITGSFEKAVEEASNILAISGKVMPSTLDSVKLGAELADGQIVWGESKIPLHTLDNPIKKLLIRPKRAKAYGPVVEAINEAEIIIIGPGSLYSSIIPNFLIDGIAEAIQYSKAKKIYICNISTEKGETEGMDVEAHLQELCSYSGEKSCDWAIVNSRIIKSEQEGELGKINNITTTRKKIGNCKIIRADVVNEQNPLYHNSEKLAKVLIENLRGN